MYDNGKNLTSRVGQKIQRITVRASDLATKGQTLRLKKNTREKYRRAHVKLQLELILNEFPALKEMRMDRVQLIKQFRLRFRSLQRRKNFDELKSSAFDETRQREMRGKLVRRCELS